MDCSISNLFKRLNMERILHLEDFKQFNDESYPTQTSEQQQLAESKVLTVYKSCRNYLSKKNLYSIEALRWQQHEKYLKKCLLSLNTRHESLHSSRVWLCYWICHSLNVLDCPLTSTYKQKIVQFLSTCQNPSGGFGGGPGQYSHIGSTYAAVYTLCMIGTEAAYNIIKRDELLNFLWRIRSKEMPGAFHIHENGEIDLRAIYCTLAVANLLDLKSDELFENSVEYIISCQTYEGGFGATPGTEAHGGYTFCGLAALTLLEKSHLCDIKSLLRWLVNRQMAAEGGFQGRTNKLIDVCYSFWVGASFSIIHPLLNKEFKKVPNHLLMDSSALQMYILICCQDIDGGLFDKPGKPRDCYHTCYALSGLSIAQSNKHSTEFTDHSKLTETNQRGSGIESENKELNLKNQFEMLSKVVDKDPNNETKENNSSGGVDDNKNSNIKKCENVFGSPINKVEKVHPVYNLLVEQVYNTINYFSNQPIVKLTNSTTLNENV